ncbi:hypothetical protein [Roseateles agri]|uniref:hypothetical protein n=1 Tax=Roseateles agri TaxID=3098619 RepID=UPI002A5A9AD7|nr:hypothetical protein [Paucibacter sp. R3-3]
MDLIELYVDGKKLPREAWRLQPRFHGELTVSRYFAWHSFDRAPAGAFLRPFGLVEDLQKVKIAHLDHRNLVLFGDQRINGRLLDQAWWCRFLVAQPVCVVPTQQIDPGGAHRARGHPGPTDLPIGEPAELQAALRVIAAEPG